jgi:hypothetical protein
VQGGDRRQPALEVAHPGFEIVEAHPRDAMPRRRGRSMASERLAVSSHASASRSLEVRPLEGYKVVPDWQHLT